MAFVHEEHIHLFQKWFNVKKSIWNSCLSNFFSQPDSICGPYNGFWPMDVPQTLQAWLHWHSEPHWVHIIKREGEEKATLGSPLGIFSAFQYYISKKIGPLIRGLEAQNHTPSPCEAKLHPPARDYELAHLWLKSWRDRLKLYEQFFAWNSK